MTVKEIQDKTGMSLSAIAIKAEMPKRTLENWKRNNVSDYRVKHLMAYIEKMRGIDYGRGQEE